MVTICKMLRIVLFPLLLLLLSMACMGQTFQYSRGWTNGKRSALGAAHFHRDDDSLPEIFEIQEGDRKFEKCLMQLQHYLRNPLQLRAGALSLNPSTANNNNNINNNPFGNHHQSNELYEELSGAGEANDYVKH